MFWSIDIYFDCHNYHSILIPVTSISNVTFPTDISEKISYLRIISTCSGIIRGKCDVGIKTQEVKVRHTYFKRISLSFIFFFCSISMVVSTKQNLRDPISSLQSSFSLMGCFFRLQFIFGILLQLRLVTCANSCIDILSGFPEKRNQVLYFFHVEDSDNHELAETS